MPHNIDLHGVTGPGGGAASSFTAPGHAVAVHVQGAQPGPVRLPLRHRAGRHARRQRHVRPDPGRAAGGPAAGRPRVLRDAGRLLHRRQVPREGPQPFDMEKAIDENPTYVLFNGAEGALTGDKALKAKAGERVRLFVGNGGPNLVSSFHVIGEIFDKVLVRRRHALPGERADHADPRRRRGDRGVPHSRCRATTCWSTTRIFRAFNKGALAILEGRRRPRTRRSTPARRSTRCTSATRARRTSPPVATAAAASASGTLTRGAAGQGRRGAVRGHLLGLPPGQRRRACRACSRRWRSPTTSLADPQARRSTIVLQRPDRPGHGQRQGLQLGDAADEPAQRRRGREHPDLRAQQLGQQRRRGHQPRR